MEWPTGTQKQQLGATILALSFHTFTTILITLILPLSFLLLARLSTAQNLLLFSSPSPTPSSIILSLFIDTTPPLIHTYVLTISLTTLLWSFRASTPRPNLYVSWVFLCVLQLGVGLGIEATIAAGMESAARACCDSGGFATLLRRGLFFVGLHETMVFWSRTVVRPVVDDTVYGAETEEWGVEKVATSAAFGGVWWWKLEKEVEGLVEGELVVGMGVVDFAGCLVYYITVMVGMLRFVKGCIWLSKHLLLKEPKEDDGKV
ncbi:hypothetical protein ACLOJK_017625 [Asimina triloba]